MIAEDFIADLTIQFRDKKDDDKNKVFYNNLLTFTNKCLEIHLKEVYDYIVSTHTYSTPFQVAKLYAYAKGKGYIAQPKIKHLPIWHKCVKCGTNYSKTGRGCPKCREHKAEIVTGETLPENIVEVQEDCFYCTIYNDIKKNPKWMTFKDCNQYGIKQDKTCKPCQCSECCNQMRMYNLDPKETTEKYKTGELAQPWIIEVEPISKMAADMLEHMNKTRFKEI